MYRYLKSYIGRLSVKLISLLQGVRKELQFLEVDTLSFDTFVHSLEPLVEAAVSRFCDVLDRNFDTAEELTFGRKFPRSSVHIIPS